MTTRRPRSRSAAGALALSIVALAGAARGDDWTNAGGDPGRNGLSSEIGPATPTVLWAGGLPSLLAWPPVTAGSRVFMVRQASFVPDQVPHDAPVVAMDLDTGAQLWTVDLPWNQGEWTTGSRA